MTNDETLQHCRDKIDRALRVVEMTRTTHHLYDESLIRKSAIDLLAGYFGPRLVTKPDDAIVPLSQADAKILLELADAFKVFVAHSGIREYRFEPAAAINAENHLRRIANGGKCCTIMEAAQAAQLLKPQLTQTALVGFADRLRPGEKIVSGSCETPDCGSCKAFISRISKSGASVFVSVLPGITGQLLVSVHTNRKETYTVSVRIKGDTYAGAAV